MATTEFGKQIKIRLVELEKNQAWLIEQIKERTGLYCDSSYVHKIMTGKIATPSIVGAIKAILDIPE